MTDTTTGMPVVMHCEMTVNGLRCSVQEAVPLDAWEAAPPEVRAWLEDRLRSRLGEEFMRRWQPEVSVRALTQSKEN